MPADQGQPIETTGEINVEESEETIELTPQQLRVLRYLARRHMRNARIMRRQRTDVVEGEAVSGLNGKANINEVPIKPVVSDPQTPVPEPMSVRPYVVPDPQTPVPMAMRVVPDPRTPQPVAVPNMLPRSALSRKHLRAARAGERRASHRLWRTLTSIVLALLLILLTLGGTAAYVAYRFVTTTQQTFEKRLLTIHDLIPPDNLKIYDSKGVLLDQLTDDGVHTTVTFDQIAAVAGNATVATEGTDFWSNQGIDPLGIARAFLTNLQDGRVVEGGSTISQQLIKNLIVGNASTIVRKLEEVVLAPQLNDNYTKSDILAMYLNTN